MRRTDNSESYDQRLIEAHAQATEIIETYTDSPGAAACKELIKLITRPNFSMEAESIIIPNKPYRARLAYRNLSKIYFRAIRLSNSAQNQWQELDKRDSEKVRNFLRRQPYRRAWSENLPEVNDFLPTEYRIGYASPGPW